MDILSTRVDRAVEYPRDFILHLVRVWTEHIAQNQLNVFCLILPNNRLKEQAGVNSWKAYFSGTFVYLQPYVFICKNSKKGMSKHLKWLVPLLILILVILYLTKQESYGPAEFNPNNFKRYDLVIEEPSIKKMDSISADAIAKHDFSKTKIWFDADLVRGKDTLPGQVRLKGDKIDHYDSELRSMRLKYKKDRQNYVLSLQHPKTRRYISEWIFHELLKQEGLPYLNYSFVVVYINNKFKGLYAEEEHFSSSDIEKKWNRPHAPILRFDDENYWPEGLTNQAQEFDTKCYKEADIKCFNYGKSERKSRYYKRISMLLKGYQNGTLDASEVFDMDLMAKYYALVDLVGGTHSLRWLNCRFYFNPTSGRFEPAGFDSDSKRINCLTRNDEILNPEHHGKIFADFTFKVSYDKYLRKYSKGSFMDEFIESRKLSITTYVRAFKDQFGEETDQQVQIAYANQWVILLNILNLPLIIALLIGFLIVLFICYKVVKSKRS